MYDAKELHALLYASTLADGTYTTSGETPKNASVLKVGGADGRLVIVFNAQPRKQYSPIVVIALGIIIALSFEQPSKARFCSSICGASVTSSRLEQPWNLISKPVTDVNSDNSLNSLIDLLFLKCPAPMEYHRNSV